MNPRTAAALLGVAAAVVVVVGGTAVARDPARHAEADATVAVVHGLGGDVARLPDHSILVVPARGAPFRAVVTPSCSALASTLALLALVAVTTRGRLRHRVGALALAVTAVVIGNLTRIGASIAVGLHTGRSSLVLFHDVVGSIFGVGYTLLGYLLVVWILLQIGRAHV